MGNLATPLSTTRTAAQTPTAKPAGRILVVEDDPAVQKALRRLFETEGYTVETQSDGRSALDSFQSSAPAAIVLDLRLPKVSGRDVCKEIKALAPTVPIVVLSAASDVSDKVLLLELGADDYVTKPFSPRELAARVKALLRRIDAPSTSEKPISRGGISIDPASYRVTRDGKTVPMSTLEFRLLYYLAARPERVFSRDQLLDAVWGSERFVTPRSVDVYIRRIREKIEPDPDKPIYVKTVRGAGYIFETRTE